MGLLSAPVHVDDLEPFHRQHRILGLGIALGGATGALVWAATGWFLGLAPLLLGLAACGLVVVAGVLHMTVGAGWAQHRVARRMMRRAV